MRLVVSAVALIAIITAVGCGDDGGTKPTNHPPAIEQQNDTTAAVGDTLWLVARAQDPDGDDLTFELLIHLTIVELREGYVPDAELDETTGEFWFVPQAQDRPERRFTFVVEDGRGGADSTTFAVTVP